MYHMSKIPYFTIYKNSPINFYIAEIFLAEKFVDIGKYGDIDKFDDMGTKIIFLFKKWKTRSLTIAPNEINQQNT